MCFTLWQHYRSIGIYCRSMVNHLNPRPVVYDFCKHYFVHWLWRHIGWLSLHAQIGGKVIFTITRSRPNQIAGPGPKSGPARKSESRGPENGVSRWRRPNSEIYSQNHHFGLVYEMIYQFLGMETKNYKFGMFCQQCHPSVAPGDADIRPRNASRIPTCHLFTS